MTIFTGKDTETALQAAEKEFATSRDQLTVEVLQEPRRGFFGIGRRLAKLAVTRKESPRNQQPTRAAQPATSQEPQAKQRQAEKKSLTATQQAQPELSPEEREQQEMRANHQRNLATIKDATKGLQEYLQAIYRQLGITVQPTVRKVRAHNCEIDLATKEPGQVVGYHGRRINAVEQLGAAYLNYHGVRDVELVLDTGDYREKRQKALAKIMERSITQVIATNQAVFLDPMPARERKYLHKLAEKSDQVRTYSHGREPFRSIVIAPQN
jgi:spoIIIJ-associated protein